MRFPAVRQLKSKIATSSVFRSVEYLLSKRGLLKRFSDVEDFVFSEEPEVLQNLKGCEHNLINVRSMFARQLWSREYYIGVTVLDSLIFDAFAHTETDDPIRLVLERIRDLGLHRPGFILYPLHSIGVLGAGVFHSFTRSQIQFTLDNYGLALTPQTNSFEKTVNFIDGTSEMIGISQRAPRDLMEHWHRSRPTQWLVRNPLLLLRVKSFPGTYYENQFFLIVKLKLATSLIYLLSTLQKFPNKQGSLYLSSSGRINNFQTLDIRHYFYFYPKPGNARKLDGDCVPMNVRASSLSELSDLAVELDPNHWRRRSVFADRICAALQTLESGYAEHTMRRRRNRLRARVFRKLFDALTFFRKSFRQCDDSIDAVVNLAIAFEVLLIDSYAPGMSERIVRRLSLALRGIPGKRSMIGSLEKLYDARSQYVHAGRSKIIVDIEGARKAFTNGFLSVVELLDRLPRSSDQPIGNILGDTE